MACYPWWHDLFRRWRGVRYSGGVSLKRGSGEDFVRVASETLRANAEAKLREAGALRGFLPLDVYSLARNVASETGSGTAEQKMVLALSSINRAKMRGVSPTQLITQNAVHPGLYGRVHPDGNIGSAPYRRFTASSLEPSMEDLLIAMFAYEGRAGVGVNDFSRGADDQAQAGKSEQWIRKEARERDYWVGDIPGIDPREITLFRSMPWVHPSSAEGQALLMRALDMHMRPQRGPFEVACVDPSQSGTVVSGPKRAGSILATLFPPLAFLD